MHIPGLTTRTCANCGARIDKKHRYCPECGTPQPGADIECGNCRAMIPADSKFCPNCSAPVAAAVAPEMRENRWQRPANALAVRIEPEDLSGAWTQRLITDPGTQAIIIDDGETQDVQGPGRYTLENMKDRIERLLLTRSAYRRAAIVVDTQPVELSFDLQPFFSRDPLRVGTRLRLVVRVVEPLKLYLTLLRSRVRFTQDDLHDLLQPELEDILRERIGNRTAAEIQAGAVERGLLQQTLELLLRDSLERHGLELVQLRTLEYTVRHQAEIQGKLEEYLLQTSEAEADIAGRRPLFAALTEKRRQEMAEETERLKDAEQRLALRAKWRELSRSEEFQKQQDAQARLQMMRDFDRQKLISDDEWQRFQQTLSWRNNDDLSRRRRDLEDRDWAREIAISDRERDRAHFLARIELENEYELAQLRLRQREELEPDELEHELSMTRRRLEGEQALAIVRQEFTLHQEARAAEFQRSQQQLDDISRREREWQDVQTQTEIRLRQARTEVEIMALEREQDRADGELGILLLEKMKLMKVRVKEEEEQQRLRVKERDMDLDLQAEQRRLDMQRQKEDAESARRMAEKKQDQEYDLSRMAELKGMSPAELIIVAPDNDRARLLQDLQKTQTYSGMSEQQILASMTSNSADAGKALAEIANAAAAEKLTAERVELYERLLRQSGEITDQARRESDRLERLMREHGDQQERIMREQGDRQERMMGKAVDAQRDATSGVAQGGGAQQPIIVTGSGQVSSGSASGTPAAGERLRCPNCNEFVSAEANFCPNCRHQLRGGGPARGTGS